MKETKRIEQTYKPIVNRIKILLKRKKRKPIDAFIMKFRK